MTPPLKRHLNGTICLQPNDCAATYSVNKHREGDMEDNRPKHVKEADEFLKVTDESIKDDMLYWIAQQHPAVFVDAKRAAL